MTNPQKSDLQIVDYVPGLKLGLQLECDPNNFIDLFVLTTGFWEPLVVGALRGLVKPGDVCVDVGANAGYLSFIMGRFAGPSGKVLSFEPNQQITPKFLRNLSLNPELESVVQLHPMGLGKEASRMFVAPDTGIGMGNAGLTGVASDDTTHSVDVITLDSLDLPRLDCIKIDVEGMELDVLRGAERTISRFVPNIIFETLQSAPPERHKPIEDYLRSLGYRMYCLDTTHGRFEEIAYPDYPQDDSFAIHPIRAKLEACRQ